MIALRTPRLTLDPVVEADADFVLALLNDPGWIRNIGPRNVRTAEDARAYIRDRFTKSLWLVARDAAGQAVGLCGLVEREGLEVPDLGYALLERHAGQGYATEAAGAVLQHARDQLGLTRLAAITTPDNHASQRVLEKLGFVRLGSRTLPGADHESAYFEITLSPREARGER